MKINVMYSTDHGAASQPSYSASEVNSTGMYSETGCNIMCDNWYCLAKVTCCVPSAGVSTTSQSELISSSTFPKTLPVSIVDILSKLIYLVSGHWKYLCTSAIAFRVPACLTVQLEHRTSIFSLSLSH